MFTQSLLFYYLNLLFHKTTKKVVLDPIKIKLTKALLTSPSTTHSTVDKNFLCNLFYFLYCKLMGTGFILISFPLVP